MNELPESMIEYEFDAPKTLVWRAWTEPELLKRWYCVGADTVIHKFELKPGGLWLNERQLDGASFYQKMQYLDISPPDRLVLLLCTANENWDVAPDDIRLGWPLVLLTTVTFEEHDGRTKVQLRQVPVSATERELACFRRVEGPMSGGWLMGYAIIEEILAELSPRNEIGPRP